MSAKGVFSSTPPPLAGAKILLTRAGEPEPGVFGSLEPEPLEKKRGAGAGAGAAWKKSQEPEPEPVKISRLLSPARR